MKNSTLKCLAFFVAVVLLGSACKKSLPLEDLVEVSMVQILANPGKYDGKVIKVIGVYRSAGLENSGVYLTRDDALVGNLKSGFFIAGYEEGRIVLPDSPSLEGRVVSVTGTLLAREGGHLGLWAGLIYNVKSISVFDERDGKWLEEKTRAR